MIDSLGIFTDLKNKILEKIDCVEIWATGSRVSGKSRANKWDFDLIIVYKEKSNFFETLKNSLENDFDGRLDENNKKIRVDLWFVHENKKNKFIRIVNLGRNVKLY